MTHCGGMRHAVSPVELLIIRRGRQASFRQWDVGEGARHGKQGSEKRQPRSKETEGGEKAGADAAEHLYPAADQEETRLTEITPQGFTS